MKLCIKYRLNPSPEQEELLCKLGFYATKLYNTDNYQRREQWDATGKNLLILTERFLRYGMEDAE